MEQRGISRSLRLRLRLRLRLSLELRCRSVKRPSVVEWNGVVFNVAGQQIPGEFLMNWTADLRATLRSAAARPVFATMVLLTLGIGTGAAAAVFAIVDAVLIRPLPYPESERITGVWFASPNFPGGLERVRQSKATYLHFRDGTRTFASLGLAEETAVTLDDGTRPTRVPAAQVTADLFAVLRIRPAIGRPLTEADNLPGAEPVVILADPLWRSAFGGRPDVLDRIVRIDGIDRRIVGVLPPSVRFPDDRAALWVPLEIDPAQPDALDFLYTGYARLADGVTPAAAARDFDRLVALLPEAYPTSFPGPLLERLQLTSLLEPVLEERVGATRPALIVVMLAVLVVLLVVIANAAGLFLVRNESRQQDMATRLALGARPYRLVRSIVSEAITYGMAGAALGTGVAIAGIALLRGVGPDSIPRLAEVAVDGRTVAVVAMIALAVGLLVSLVPALRIRALDAGSVLRAGRGAVGASRQSLRLRGALVAGQVALALVLLMNAGVLMRSLAALQAVDPGFRPTGTLGARLYLPESDYPDFEQGRSFFMDLAERASGLPGVRMAAVGTFLPLRDGRVFYPFEIEGVQQTADLPTPRQAKVVSNGWFETLGIALLEGRTLDRADIEAGTDVVVVNRAFARLYWADGSALGRRLRYGGTGADQTWFTVVGVVEDVRDRDLAADPPPIVYFPLQQRHASNARWREMSIALAGAGQPPAVEPLRDLVAGLDPSLPLDDVRTMSQVVSDATSRQRYTMVLVAVTAASALFLAAIGLYGVLAHMVADRRREMGLRIALGAEPRRIRRLILGRALGLTTVGLAVGIPLTLASAKLSGSILFGVAAVDPLTMAGVAVLITIVAWAAARIPAGRASAVAPALTLRD